MQKLKAIDNIKAQNILKLKINKQEKRKKKKLYVIFASNDKFFNFNSILFKIFLQIIEEFLQNFLFKLAFVKTSK